MSEYRSREVHGENCCRLVISVHENGMGGVYLGDNNCDFAEQFDRLRLAQFLRESADMMEASDERTA